MNKGSQKEMLMDVLKASSLFSKVSPEMMSELAGKMTIISHETGETIIRKDDLGFSMYLIVSGEVKVHDHEHIIARLFKGEFFGEMSILDHEPRSMSVSALVPTLTGNILLKDFYDILNRFPGMTGELIAYLSRRLRKQNTVLIEQQQNKERDLQNQVAERTADLKRKNEELEQVILKLKESQQQLIMQEKLASLGSLTAGVAHELHNPLNFVNNFTELSLDLIKEINGSDEIAVIREHTAAIKNNLEKILNHGQRAETIIKAMLMHSNTGKSRKVITDINFLCEQAASMVSYNASTVTPGCPVRLEKSFDENLPKVEVVPRDISKVLINLLNNAYYDVSNKWKISKQEYEPRISFSTGIKDNRISIIIRDNGNGIAKKHLDKIFEPFYTTKPTGEGVGLGLSISNDIIGAHGGKIMIDTKENSHSSFTLIL
jgi:histidine kinase